MARIRTLKPEFWDSPSTAKADLAVRLTFMAMWNWADDSGRGTANMKELEAFTFPNDDITTLPRKSCGNSAGTPGSWRNFSEICGEVAECYGVVFYEVKGRPYYWIPSFREHQSRDFRETSRYPSVEEGQIVDLTSGNTSKRSPQDSAQRDPESTTSADTPGNSAGSNGNSDIGTGEQGNRGTGEQITTLVQPQAVERENETPPRRRNNYPEDFETFWQIYPRRESKKTAHTAFTAALKRADLETILDGARRYRDDPNRTDEYTKIPPTWLRADGWEDDPLPERNHGQLSAADQRAYRDWGRTPPRPNRVQQNADVARQMWEQENRATGQRKEIGQ